MRKGSLNLAQFAACLLAVHLCPGIADAKDGHKKKSQVHAVTGPVILTDQPGSELDKQARELNKAELADALAHNDQPVVLVASVPLSTYRTDMALFVQLQSARLCGSAGCSTSVYLKHRGSWTRVLDSVSGQIAVLVTSHKGMRDLQIDKTDHWHWNGSGYQDGVSPPPPTRNTTQPAPVTQKKKLLHG